MKNERDLNDFSLIWDVMKLLWVFTKKVIVGSRGGFRTVATSKMEHFVTIAL